MIFGILFNDCKCISQPRHDGPRTMGSESQILTRCTLRNTENTVPNILREHQDENADRHKHLRESDDGSETDWQEDVTVPDD